MKRDNFTMPLDFPGELIIDNFAGGGGTSEGLEQAFGRPVDVAINHDPEALAMHALNHPHTTHLCESVWTVNPIKVTRNQPVALVWLSPDCKHFSKAKGGTPVAKHIRGLAWVGMRWAAMTKPRVIMLENVEEFQDWGPLIVGDDGHAYPDPAKKGKTFDSFVRQLRGHGYHVDWRELRACDQGAPTIRKRLFMVARRDGLPITWPETEYAEPSSRAVLAGKMRPFRTAAECIDFNLPAASIFTRKKDLAENTQRRVAKGLWRHVLTSPKPFIVNTRNGERHGQEPRVRSLDEPYWTVTSQGSQGAVAEPVLAPFVADQSRPQNAQTAGADQPLRTQCAQVKGGHFTLVGPQLAPFITTNTTGHAGGAAEDPLPTVATGGHHALTAAHITKFRTGSSGCNMHEPMPTVTANSFIKRPGGSAPLGVVAATFLEQANGGFNEGNDGRSVDVPVSTIASKGANQRLITAYCVKYYSSGGQWQGLAEPMHTLPTKGRMGLVQTIQVAADCLAPEHQDRARACAALLHKYLPEHFPKPADLVLIGDWVLVDITLRMLRPRELFRAQGFPYWTESRIFLACHASPSSKSIPAKPAGSYSLVESSSDWCGAVAVRARIGFGRLVLEILSPGKSPSFASDAEGSSSSPLPTEIDATARRIARAQSSADPAHRTGRAAQAPTGNSSTHRRNGERRATRSGAETQQPAAAAVSCIGTETIATTCTTSRDTQGSLSCDSAWATLSSYVGRVMASSIRGAMPEASSFAVEILVEDGYVIEEIPDPKLLFKDGVQAANPLAVPRIPLTATAQVRMCGNSVSPPQARALVLANFAHERLIYGRKAA